MKENEISKKEVIATTVVIIILVLFLVCVYNYYSFSSAPQQPYVPPPSVRLGEDVVTEDYIRYNVSSIAEHSDEEVHQSMYGEEYYEYEIYNRSRYHDPYLRGDLSSIRNITDYPVIWIDNDGDHQISVSDKFIIDLEDIPDDMDRFRLTYRGPYFGRLTVCREDISDLTANLSGSDDMSEDGVPNDQADDMSRYGMPSEYGKEYGVANGGWQNSYQQREVCGSIRKYEGE